MLNDLTLGDQTQEVLLSHLKVTERLLSEVTGNEATITAMPDLGIAHNIKRMMGGFYTGARYEWNCDFPFIPVDTTVNVCGTALFKIAGDITAFEFISLPKAALADTTRYSWNYTNGNHFISLVYSNGDYGFPTGFYLLLHASSNEFKDMLYPSDKVFYNNDIKVITDEATGRYLRYIRGIPATKFYGIAKMLLDFNLKRNRDFAELMLGNRIEKEVLSIQHYGMPNESTVCIGTHFECKTYPLLTAPGRPIFIVEPDPEKFDGTPHGFGLGLKNPTVIYERDSIIIGDKKFTGKDSINIGTDALVRCANPDDNLDAHVANILKLCPGKITGILNQVSSVSRDGTITWYKEEI